MNKRFKQSVLGSALVVATGLAQAEVTANVAAVSDYLFRGISQSSNAAIQGGLDYSDASGIYAGTWLSNIDFGGEVEVDLYAGYGGETGGGLGYDVGVLYYWYPDSGGDQTGSELDYGEITFGLSMGMFSANIAYTAYGETSNAPFNTGDIYFSVGADIPLQNALSLGLTLGYYSFEDELDDDSESYAHFAVGLGKDVGDFGSVAVNMEFTNLDEDHATLNDDGPNVWLGWSKEF
ncbi:MAG: TorF family putative porin [Gammaproteobacteria bacterium]